MTKQSDGIWIIDSHGSTLYANLAMGKILDAAKQLGAFLKANKERREAVSLPPQEKTDRHIWTDVQGTPMHNAAGESLRIVSTFRGPTSSIEN